MALRMGKNDVAIASLSRAISVKTNDYLARWDRAIAYLRTDKLEEARSDYEVLQTVYTNSVPIYYGLGEIAWRQKDTNAAVKYYQLYLTNAPPQSAEAKFVGERLKQLKPGPS